MATAGTPQQIIFDGTEDKYDLWETRFLSRLHILKLKDTILRVPTDDAALVADPGKNADCYAQLVNALDDKSLSLIRHEAAEDGRKLSILREHYSGKSKPRILNLYTSPTTIQMAENEDNVTFTDFKRRLRVYEESERMRATGSADSVKTSSKQSRQGTKIHKKDGDATLTCYKCGQRGHIKASATKKCESLCRKREKQMSQESCRRKERDIDDEDQCFTAKHTNSERPSANVKKKGIMVDAGAMSHIVNDITKFQSFDSSFQPAPIQSSWQMEQSAADGSTQRDGADLPTRHRWTSAQSLAERRTVYANLSHDIFSVAKGQMVELQHFQESEL
ncbi:hypothetical protein D4764_18G0007190 [Takifugu flavidus]|uniref:CCHC-type domain-containing protein n=1 Tax=Takifugu flavidus TaxID=433684 RepID=A0A5C6NRL8_9TELE|nr:hypothetical protein D4764_18G0007190 [Takifugu flavidus]